MGFKVIGFMAVALMICVLAVGFAQADDVIIVKGNHTADHFKNDVDHAYNETKNHRGFTDADITYWDGNTTLSGVDDIANETNLRNAINDSTGKNLTIYLSGHGNCSIPPPVFGCGGDVLTSTELDAMLDDWQTQHTGGHITVIIDCCGAGSFISDLSGSNRTLITSCQPCNASYWVFLNQSESCNHNSSIFSAPFWTEISNDSSVKDAFTKASEMVKNQVEFWNKDRTEEDQIPHQIPLYDDNGDGVGHPAPLPNGGDGANDTYIGISAAPYDPPVITDIVPPQYASVGYTILIWAHAMEGTPTVYAFVKYPSWAPALGPCIDVPVIELTDPDGDGNYTGLYEVTETGNYLSMIYAVDSEGGISTRDNAYENIPAITPLSFVLAFLLSLIGFGAIAMRKMYKG